jgi:hypothetical protein
MALGTKPRWDKYDGYVGNFRGALGWDVDLTEVTGEANKVLAVGQNGSGAIVKGGGQTGVNGLLIVAVGQDIHGNLLDGGINNMSGDPQDVGAHGEITNFHPYNAADPAASPCSRCRDELLRPPEWFGFANQGRWCGLRRTHR